MVIAGRSAAASETLSKPQTQTQTQAQGGNNGTNPSGGRARYQDGDISRARFSSLSGVALDKFGALFVADLDNARVRRIDVASALIRKLVQETAFIVTGIALPGDLIALIALYCSAGAVPYHSAFPCC